MKLMLYVLAASALLELIIMTPLGWRVRKYIAAVALLAIAVGSGGTLASWPGVATGLVLGLSAYRALNMLRLVEARMHEAYLRRMTRRTSAWLLLAQAVIMGIWWMERRHAIANRIWIFGLAGTALVTAVILLVSTLRHLRKTKFVASDTGFADRDLPTVTVAIPARNEDEQLEACLQAVLASDYPKLEVIVLDDCSQDSTPAIIRGFAHDGVRFVSGKEPSPTWLAKNQAYDTLAKEASGELILFCGVDVRFGPRSIHQLVTSMLQKQKTMMSVTPLVDAPGTLSVVQSMRYFWELALPRRMFNRPPVLSSCWAITKKNLEQHGGFAAVSRSIVPEAFFARQAAREDGYSFVRSSVHLDITSVKSFAEQRATATRTRYPQLHRRPEMTALVAGAELALLIAPFVLAVVGAWGVFGLVSELLLIATCLVLMITYRSITLVAFPRGRWVALPVFPFAVLLDLCLMHYSMWKYEFSEVVWKGRNVCIPAMHAIPHLPKLR